MSKDKLIEIAERAIRGEEGAFEELCNEKGRDIVYLAIRLMGNAQDGEDAAQEILAYMYMHIKELEDAKAFRVWMYRVTRGVCANMRRNIMRKKMKKEIIELEEDVIDVLEDRTEFLPEEFLEHEDKREVLLEIINKLPYKCKMCVLLFYYEGCSYADVAGVLDISRKDVDNSLMKAKRIIRRKIMKDKRWKKALDAPLSVAVLPLLTRVLTSEANIEQITDITERVLNRNTQMISTATAAGGLGKAAIKAMSGSSNSAASTAATGISSKVTVGIAVAVSSAAIGTAVYVNRAPEESYQETPSVTESVPEPQTIAEVPAEAEEVELEIKTLGDMIGEQEAEQLQSYCVQKRIAYEEAELFLSDIGMEEKQSIISEAEGFFDRLYYMERQDKLLLVIARYEEAEQKCQMVYQFTEVGTEMPESIEITLCFEEWQMSKSGEE